MTEITYYIPKNIISAKIIIHDMNGTEIKSYPLTSNQNKGTLHIKGEELKAGLHQYSLAVNNKLIDTKKMLLTK